ncbi:methylmalonyl-CoA mutase subunit beta [Phytohabitans houttuyneae]|uniref:Methylmalonyl-CoA mutase n=1 Tax=Phytohabitans houttuyneae TaxID=1076126 RepID=A0A6V8KKH0_9ACTN|nr:methylmalonyl-CoA mutase subunit beta [Phytohabitans houttuyneae]GFJ82257.1 methylmalonyl-CoA mutase [Phytohabitans houttuyneae]
MSSTGFPLAADFPAATAEQWQRAALGVLRKTGAAGEDAGLEAVDALLATSSHDGVRSAPLYTRADTAPAAGLPGLFPFTRGGRAAGAVVSGWDVRQRHDEADPKLANEAIHADLENGATSLWLALGEDGLAAGALPDVLDGVYLDLAGVVLDAGGAALEAAEAWLGFAASTGVAAADLSGGLGLDPLGWRARTGLEGPPLPAVAALAGRLTTGYPGLRAVTVDATVYHDAGAGDAQELGCAAAAGVAYLRALTGAGLDAAAAFGQLEFRYAATADQFATIAKLRAARRIWSRVAELCGVPDAGAQRQHAVTSAAMMTARDPWVNMLRTTLACFAAGVGGADAVTVRPFDERLGGPDGFSRRIARNTQALLLDEAHAGRVVDPAGGSWYVERLTEETARAAWDWFTEIERAGGMAAALGSGLVADRLAETWQRRAASIAHRRDPITGVSEFPQVDERLPRQPAEVATPPAGGLPRHHYAEAFERLRDRGDAHAAATGSRPVVFLATLGPPPAHTARATFAANLFAAGGIAAVTGAVEEFAASGAPVACLCSSDRTYTDAATPAARALAAAGARRIWLAGKPGGYEAVDGYLYSGCDAVDVLETTLRELGVP